jgi:hypothetical protein
VPADPAFYGPLQYSPVWMWVGIALVALVAGWYVVVFASTRRPRMAEGVRRSAALTDLSVLKAAYLQRIDDVERDAAAGNLSLRAAHHEISHLLRSFVRDATGVDALRMTRQDLERHPLPAPAAVVGILYPAQFGVEPLPSVAVSAASARNAVSTWS